MKKWSKPGKYAELEFVLRACSYDPAYRDVPLTDDLAA
jgi:hypothetical protein